MNIRNIVLKVLLLPIQHAKLTTVVQATLFERETVNSRRVLKTSVMS